MFVCSRAFVVQTSERSQSPGFQFYLSEPKREHSSNTVSLRSEGAEKMDCSGTSASQKPATAGGLNTHVIVPNITIP